MQSDYPIRYLSEATHPAIHGYYDVCPEDPGGQRILYSRWQDEQIPGPAEVVIAKLDGSEPQVLSDQVAAIGHVGRFPHWLSDDRVAFQAELGDQWQLLDLPSGTIKTFIGSLRQFHVATGRGLVQRCGTADNPNKLLQTIGIVDVDGQDIGAFSAADARAAHPDPGSLPPVEQLNLMNAKWSPDGSQFFTVFTNQIYRRSWELGGEVPLFKCLVLANADGSDVRFLGDFNHHPHWHPDGSCVFAMDTTLGQSEQDLIAYDCADGKRRVLLQSVPGVHSTIAADGRSLIIDEFDAPADGQGRLNCWDLLSGERETLVTFTHSRWDHQDGHHPHPVLSRDGRSIYFNAMDNGKAGLYALQWR